MTIAVEQVERKGEEKRVRRYLWRHRKNFKTLHASESELLTHDIEMVHWQKVPHTQILMETEKPSRPKPVPKYDISTEQT